MTLRDLIKKLNAFKCDALLDKEVAHCFAEKGYGYKETVIDVVFDANKGLFMIKCGDIEHHCWDDKAIVSADGKEKA